MNFLRTRLRPGHPWVNSTGGLSVAPDSQLAVSSISGQPRIPGLAKAPAEAGAPQGQATQLPGLEVIELDSETVFDRLFGGPPDEPLPPRRW